MDVRQAEAQVPVTAKSTIAESTILERVARIISSVRGARPDYAHLAAELASALPFDLFGIVLLNHDRQAVRVTVCEREGAGWIARYHRLPLAESMMARMMQAVTPAASNGGHLPLEGLDALVSAQGSATETMLVEDFPTGATGLPAQCGDSLCGHPQLRAILVAPLIAGSELLGTLELGSTELGAYGSRSLQRLIGAIASVLATAIEGAQAGGNVEIQNRQRDGLKDVSTILTTAVDLSTILERIVTAITNALRVSSAIVRLDQHQHCLHLAAQSGLEPVLLRKVLMREDVLSERSILGATLLLREMLASSDIAQDERFPLSYAFATDLHIHSLSCFPLLAGNSVYGALLLLSSDSGGFTPLKADIFTLFAGQATVAIQNGMLLRSAQERRAFQQAIEQFEQVAHKKLVCDLDGADEQELLSCLRQATQNTFGVSFGSVLRFISDHLLTRSERDLQDILYPVHVPSMTGETRSSAAFAPQGQYSEEALLARTFDVAQPTALPSQKSTSFLVQAANTALAHTDFLRKSSTALMHVLHVDEAHPQAYEHLKHELAEPWFIVGLDGNCLLLNRAAELFCEQRLNFADTSTWDRWSQTGQTLLGFFRPLTALQETTLTLEQLFGPLWPRVRRLKDLQIYLSAFTVIHSSNLFSQQNETPPPVFLRCPLAAESLPGQVALAAVDTGHAETAWSTAEPPEPRAVIAPPDRQERARASALLTGSSPSDRHYHFMRHALYDEQGQWFANALHVHDVTKQVHDEKNKAVLLASVSHDLRTPLTSIKAAVTGLLQPDVVWAEDLRREALQEINAEADHLHSLVNAFVEMSRIEMGALTLDKEWCDIAELVHNTLDRTQRLLGDFAVQVRLSSPLPLIYADYVQLGRVLTNLLENAARYSAKQTRIVVSVDLLELRASPLDTAEARSGAVRVQIADEGPGIPEEERERIFKSFYSLHAQGNGLGLAICRGIVEAHHGHIWVEASEYGGACFVFVLPIVLSLHDSPNGS